MSDLEQAKAREAVMALIGFLSLAEAPNLTAAQRAEFATAAERQARLLRDLLDGPLLLVLAREHAHQAERLKQAFGSGVEIEVIIDRRTPEALRASPQAGRRSGLEVLSRIRGIDPSIPVSMLTGASRQESSQALKSGAFAYLPKPFDFRYVDHLVTLATDQKRR
ncbi:MAG: response regulator [Candidatus Rokuibacteriota bacterium]